MGGEGVDLVSVEEPQRASAVAERRQDPQHRDEQHQIEQPHDAPQLGGAGHGTAPLSLGHPGSDRNHWSGLGRGEKEREHGRVVPPDGPIPNPVGDPHHQPYDADANDAAYATFELEGGIIAQINSSWCTRVNRGDLVTFQVDGTEGSAVAGLHDCVSQSLAETPKPVWNPDEPRTHDFLSDWKEVPAHREFDNGFKTQWEMFIRHLFDDAPWEYTLLEGAKGVQLAELGMQSWAERRWIDIPDLTI